MLIANIIFSWELKVKLAFELVRHWFLNHIFECLNVNVTQKVYFICGKIYDKLKPDIYTASKADTKLQRVQAYIKTFAVFN